MRSPILTEAKPNNLKQVKLHAESAKYAQIKSKSNDIYEFIFIRWRQLEGGTIASTPLQHLRPYTTPMNTFADLLRLLGDSRLLNCQAGGVINEMKQRFTPVFRAEAVIESTQLHVGHYLRGLLYGCEGVNNGSCCRWRFYPEAVPTKSPQKLTSESRCHPVTKKTSVAPQKLANIF